MLPSPHQQYQCRQNVRLVREAGRRHETSNYPGYWKLKEICSRKKGGHSSQSLSTGENSKKTPKRPRRKTTHVIQQPASSSEKKPVYDMQRKTDDEDVQTNKMLPDSHSLVSLENISCGLRPSYVTSSQSVPLNVNRSKSLNYETPSDTLLSSWSAPDPVSAVLDLPRSVDAEMKSQPEVQESYKDSKVILAPTRSHSHNSVVLSDDQNTLAVGAEALPGIEQGTTPQLNIQDGDLDIQKDEVKDSPWPNILPPQFGVFGELQHQKMHIIPYHGFQQNEEHFERRPQNHAGFWEEWSAVSHLRTSVLVLRSRTHGMRRIMRDMQLRKTAAEDKLVQRVLQQELASGSTSRTKERFTPKESILDLVRDSQEARDEFGPFEAKCTDLEDQLYRDEFKLHQLEEQMYLRWNVVPNLRVNYQEEYHEPHQFFENSPIPSIQFREDQKEYEEIKYHPLVEQYLSKKGDLEMIKEQLYEFEERVYDLQEDQESRARYGLSLYAEDEEFLGNSSANRRKITQNISENEEQLQKLKATCEAMKLVDKNGQPTTGEEWKNIEIYEENKTGIIPEMTEDSSFEILVTHPEKVYPDFTSDSSREVAEAAHSSQATSDLAHNLVEIWMLMVMRCSIIEANRLATWSKSRGVTISDNWQDSVLELWFKDGSSNSIPVNPRTTSLSTQEPIEARKKAPIKPIFYDDLPMRKKPSPPHVQIRLPSALSVVITDIDDVMGPTFE